MKKQKILILLLAVFSLGFSLAAQQSAHDTFQKALTMEQTAGDLEGAIALYQKVVDSAGEESLAAQAQLRIGICYEKLGNAMAVKSYEAVLSRFPKQAEAVAEAKARLAVLQKEEPAGLTLTRLLPPDVYLECQTLSPDGTKVVGIDFSKGQNVAVYDLAANKLDFVTDYEWGAEDRWTYVPVWSPESRRIAFLSAGWRDNNPELWISDLGGQSRLLYKNPRGTLAPCDWLPDGSAVLAVVEGDNSTSKLGFISVNEGSLREVCSLSSPFKKEGDPILSQQGLSADISPDGRSIAFSDATADGKGDIYCISRDGRTKTVLIDHPADDKQPRWAPDGSHIVFLSDRHGSWALWGLAVRDGKADGTSFMILEGMQNSALASWTTEGLQTTSFISLSEINILDIDPQSHTALGKPHILELAHESTYGGCSWSPDGQYLSFASASTDGQNMVIWLPEGGQFRYLPLRPVSTIQGGSIAWLPDSSGLGMIYWDKEKQIHFGRLNLATGQWETRAVPSDGFGFKGFAANFNSIVWTAAGEKLSFIYLRRDGTEPLIVARELDTGLERTICRLQPSNEFGRFIKASGDQRLLALHDGLGIIVADTATGQTRRFDFGEKKPLFQPSLSQDGKFLVVKGAPETGGEWTELYIITLEDGKFQSLDINRYITHGGRIQMAPDLSPDGRKIAYDTRVFKAETNLIRNVISEK